MRGNELYKYKTLTYEMEDGTLKIDEPFLKVLIEKAKQRNIFNHVSFGTPIHQNPADPEKYLEGLCWMLDMYSKGFCLDYRFIYDAVSPTVADIHKLITNRIEQKNDL